MITGRRGVSLPFSDYCDMIIAQDVSPNDILKELIDYARQADWRSIEFMDGRYLPADTPGSSFYYEHTLDLGKDEGSVVASFSENTRRNIRKALQNNVDVQFGKSEDSVIEFYRLHCVTRKRHGLPPQPLKFFKSIYKNIIANDLGFILIAKHKGMVIAGAIYYHFCKQAISKYGASDMRYKRTQANSLVMWRAIEWLVQNGYRKLSFGRTDVDNKGLRRFKKAWGSSERLVTYYTFDVRKEAFVDKPLGIVKHRSPCFRLMPSFMLRAAGTILYRHIG